MSPITSMAEVHPYTEADPLPLVKTHDCRHSNKDSTSQLHESPSRISLEALGWPLPSSSISSSTLRCSPSFSPLYRRSDTIKTADTNNSSTEIEMLDMRLNVICNWLHQQQLQRMWSIGEEEEGVLVRKSKGKYVCCPRDLLLCKNGLHNAIQLLNVKVRGLEASYPSH